MSNIELLAFVYTRLPSCSARGASSSSTARRSMLYQRSFSKRSWSSCCRWCRRPCVRWNG